MKVSEANLSPSAKTSVGCYRFSNELFAALQGKTGTELFDGLVIDLTESGFDLPMRYMFIFTHYAAKSLKPGGVMVLLSKTSALALEADHDGTIGIKCFKPIDGIFANWPFLTETIRTAVPGFEHLHSVGASSFRTYVINNIVPILTEAGRKTRAKPGQGSEIDFILGGVDDSRNIATISGVALRDRGMSEEEVFRLLKILDTNKLIFPIFKRIEFLVNCFTHQKSFRLGRYFVAAGIMSEGELVALLERQQEVHANDARILLGRLALDAGYFNERYLNMLIQEQYIFGGHRTLTKVQNEGLAGTAFGDSLFGSLGTIEPPGLLQSIATTQKKGVLTVESSRGAIAIGFDAGRCVAARLNRLVAVDAITEFIVSWSEGVFLFKESTDFSQFSQATQFKINMNKILLDAALLQDNVITILSEFPQGSATIFERVWNFESEWKTFDCSKLQLFVESILSENDAAIIFEMAQMIDGFSTVEEIVKQNALWPSYKSLYGLHLLLKQNLISTEDNSLVANLRDLRRLYSGMTVIFGADTNREMLMASLAQGQGRYAVAHNFQAAEDGIAVQMNKMKTEGLPVSSVLEALNYIKSTYIAFGRRLNKALVDNLLTSKF